eukprot:6463501-Amphidinium_carterae.3
MQRHAAAERKETEKLEDSWLADYEEQIGLAQVKLLQQNTPELSCFDLVAVPAASTMQCYELGCKSIKRGVAAAAWTFKHKSDAGKMLNDQWQVQHHLKTDVADDETVTDKSMDSKCREAGVCLCNPSGQLLRKLHARFCCLLKKAFCTPDQKKELAAGSIVVVISTSPDVVAPTLQPTEVEKSEQHIFGIPLMYFTPYRATLELLLPVPDDSNVSQVPGQVCVKVAFGQTTK